MQRWEFPAWVKLSTALIVTGSAVTFVLLHFQDSQRWFLLYYFVPVAVPFTYFALERLTDWRRRTLVHLALDLVLVSLSAIRGFYPLPGFSGHSLFLTYALATGQSWTARILAALVLAETAYLKLFVWNDQTFWGGLGFGLLAAAVYTVLSGRPALPATTPDSPPADGAPRSA